MKKENSEAGTPQIPNENPTKKKPVSKKATAEAVKDANANQEAELQAVSDAVGKPVQEEIPAEKNNSDAICIVIPYLAAKAKADELRYAVRAWEKSISGVRIVIVGDMPPWAGKELDHIPHTPTSTNPQIDVAHKMMAAIASDLVPNVFVWSNDDIYTLCPVELADIITLKSHGLLTVKGKANGLYHQNANRTLEALRKHGVTSPADFATHTPVMLEKGGLANIIERFGCDKEGHLVYTLYANVWFRHLRPTVIHNDGRGSIAASVYRSNPDPEILKNVLATRKWVNNDDAGWKALEPKLKELFPDKCRFEK